MKTKNFKKAVIFLLVYLAIHNSVLAQIGIGTTTPDASSMLDVRSNAKGVLIHRMTNFKEMLF